MMKEEYFEAMLEYYELENYKHVNDLKADDLQYTIIKYQRLLEAYRITHPKKAA